MVKGIEVVKHRC